ncbi:MAG: hypothetical protein JRD89_14435 [Deltaproteobacteria bacterium]|nr:hypothetical protein [Deltaproteobacteria bacterium]
MVDYFKLDKTFVEGSVYETPSDRFYVIRKLGTDSASAAKLVIDGVETGEIFTTIAPLHKTSSNLLGPLDLGDLYYVVPPNKTFYIDGPSAAKMRAIGQIGVLAPGEALPAPYAGRFAEQGKHYRTYLTDTYSISGAGTWTADAAYEVISLTPNTIEVYKLNSVVGATVSGFSAAEGDVGIIFKLDGKPLDILTTAPGKKGIDVKSMPLPPAATTEQEPFSFADMAIDVLGDHTLTVEAMNVKGADISFTDLSITVTAMVEYLMKQ